MFPFLETVVFAHGNGLGWCSLFLFVALFRWDNEVLSEIRDWDCQSQEMKWCSLSGQTWTVRKNV